MKRYEWVNMAAENLRILGLTCPALAMDVSAQLALTARDGGWTLADYIINDIICKVAASDGSERQHEGPSIYPRPPQQKPCYHRLKPHTWM